MVKLQYIVWKADHSTVCCMYFPFMTSSLELTENVLTIGSAPSFLVWVNARRDLQPSMVSSSTLYYLHRYYLFLCLSLELSEPFRKLYKQWAYHFSYFSAINVYPLWFGILSLDFILRHIFRYYLFDSFDHSRRFPVWYKSVSGNCFELSPFFSQKAKQWRYRE